MSSQIKIVIGVATFQRPVGLSRLMESLSDLETGDFDVHLITADNDADASARSTVERLADQLPFPVTYVVEPSRGLSAVRNRLVAEARTIGADFMASADDDQTVDPGWVRELVSAAIEFEADAVVPRLLYAFPAGTSQAIQNCFHNPNPHRSPGTVVRLANSGGSLYRLSALEDVPGPFDERLNLSGGEDSMLSLELNRRNKKIIACDTALITEHMPASRLNFRWIANRAWWEGKSRAQEIKWMDPSLGKTLLHAVLFTGYAGKNALMVLPDLLRYRVLPLRRVRLIIFGVSGLKHLVVDGPPIEAYATPDGQ